MMESNFSKGFYLTLITAILVTAISLLTEYKQELFVPESGNLKFFGGVGIILSIGLLLKWKYVREILGVLVVFSLFAMAFIFLRSESKFLIPRLGLFLSFGLIAYLLIFAKDLREYIEGKK